MTAPRLEIDLDKIHHNARALVEALARRSISVTGVTKATLGSPDIAQTMLDAGATASATLASRTSKRCVAREYRRR